MRHVLQVHALLEQLQELLRRAEVERDRAKMQLKRHRVSLTKECPAAAGLSVRTPAQRVQSRACICQCFVGDTSCTEERQTARPQQASRLAHQMLHAHQLLTLVACLHAAP